MKSPDNNLGTRYLGQPILVVGLGVSGVSTLHYLMREGAAVTVTDSRENPEGIARLREQYPHVEFYLGGFRAPAPLSQFSEAVVSPGVDLRDPFIVELRAQGIAVVGDIELFARVAKAPIVGITGSNGKSTVTTLLGEMAQAAGLVVGVGGNLAPPALDVLREDADLYVLELSSFQLETTHTLACRAAVILNISEDHLDRHGTMAAYAAAKARIWDRCDVCVANADDPLVMELLQAQPRGNHRAEMFSLNADWRQQRYGLVTEDGEQSLASAIYGSTLPVVATRLKNLKIKGLHNAANALAALALADVVGIPRAVSVEALLAYRGLPHRCVPVACINGNTYYNDSKGTNVGSTLAAIRGLPGPLVWLGGGQGKGQDFTPLAAALAEKASAAIVFGEDAALIKAAIFGAVPVYIEANMVDALARAQTIVPSGGSVLLSPACASLDQFKNYVDRGQQFEAAVHRLAKAQ